MNSPVPKVREKKNFFRVKTAQQKRNKNLISKKTEIIQKFCNRIGLKIDEIILSKKNHDSDTKRKIKITVKKNNSSFQALKAKDQTNLSHRKYNIMRSNMEKILPPLKEVNKLQKKVNAIFATNSNNYGIYLDPISKIEFVCKNFLEKNLDFKDTSFQIKLACDSTNLTKSNIKILNFTFSLLNETEAMSVFGTYILGKSSLFT